MLQYTSKQNKQTNKKTKMIIWFYWLAAVTWIGITPPEFNIFFKWCKTCSGKMEQVVRHNVWFTCTLAEINMTNILYAFNQTMLTEVNWRAFRIQLSTWSQRYTQYCCCVSNSYWKRVPQLLDRKALIVLD